MKKNKEFRAGTSYLLVVGTKPNNVPYVNVYYDNGCRNEQTVLIGTIVGKQLYNLTRCLMSRLQIKRAIN